MAQYQDDRHRFTDPNQHPYPTQYQQGNATGQSTAGAESEPTSASTPNSGLPSNVGGRQMDELFFNQALPPPPPPPRSTATQASPGQRYQYPPPPAQSQSYNPSAYGRPLSMYTSQSYPSVQSPSATSPPAPYNPSDYQDDNLNRVGSVRTQPAYTPANYGTSSPVAPVYSPQTPQMPAFPSPQTSQPNYGRSSLYGPPRPTIHTNSFTSEQGAPPPPPRPAQYGFSLPPLSTIPGSAIEPEEGWNQIPGRSAQQLPPTSPQFAQSYNQAGPQSYQPHLSYPSPPAQGIHRSSFSQSSRHSSVNTESPAPAYAASTNHPLPPTPQPPPPPPHDPSRTHSHQSQSHTEYFDSHASAYDDNQEQERLTAEALINEVDREVRGMGLGGTSSPSIHVDSSHASDPRYAYGQGVREDRNGSLTNGHLTPDAAYDDYQNESDLEADAGLEAMRIADEEAAAEARRSSEGSMHGRAASFASHQHMLHDTRQDTDESDGPPVDLGLFGGGFDAPHMSYGGAPEQLTVERQGSLGHAGGHSHPTSSRSGASDTDMFDFEENIHPFPPFGSTARTDTGGTGGLAVPSARRPSYDEGDETGFIDDQGGNIPDIFFHPGMSQHRPLPPPPAGESPGYGAGHMPYPSEEYSPGQIPYPSAPLPQWPQEPGSYIPASANSNVPRSTSLLSHGTQSQKPQIPRSLTDAEERERKWKAAQNRKSAYLSDSGPDTPAAPSAVPLDLPTLPTAKRYNPAKLGTKDYNKCTEPWALSGIVSWLKLMTEGEQDLREQGLVDGLVQLFTAKVPTMNIADAETLAARLVTQMQAERVLVQEEEWLKFSRATTSGVVYQLTGAGCYSPKLHVYNSSGRCYSHHCQRTLKKLDLSSQGLKSTEDWQIYYKVKKEDLEGVDGKEIERQNILHEIVQKEDKYMDDLDVLRILYRDGLAQAQPPLITPARLPSFLKDVFGKADAVKKANEDYLLPQLKYRQKEQGPWVVGFSDIFREWIRKAKSAYIAYAAAFPNANFKIRSQAEKNLLFHEFLEKVRANKLSNKLSWDTYLKVPITKLQQYGLLLETVLRRSVLENEEKRNLRIAINEIKEVTLECDAQVAQMSRKVDLKDLQNKLKLRPGMEEKVELNLDHLGRELIFKGDLQRTGSNRFTWLETHALLFDHYLVLAKTVQDRDGHGARTDTYDVSRLPIPMDLLVLESRDDSAVVRGKTGIVTVSANAQNAAAEHPGSRMSRASSSITSPPVPGQLQHSNTSTSLTSLTTTASSTRTSATTTVLDPNTKEDKLLFPFRIKHLGKELYTLYAPSAQNREDWCDKILEAKTRHAASLFQQNAEPFRLRVMADCVFNYESTTQSLGRSIIIKGTPLERAIREVEARYRDTGRPGPVCRARVNCATNFTQPDGKEMSAIGTDFGVFISSVNDPRGWSRAIPSTRVTQIAVLEEFGLFLLIAEKSLLAYHLDIVCPVGGGPSNISATGTRGAPQKLSGSRDVGFFNTGRMKDRQLVFFKKRDGLSSTFKVLEPVYQKSTEKKSRFPHFRSGRTEFFREYDEFYIPTECMGLNVFRSSLTVCSSKGFEVLTLDKKQSWSVPDLKDAAVAAIAARLQGQIPLGMFRLSEDFLCVYEECAVYVNKHGDISRSVIMEFVGRARQAALYGAYVLLFDSEFVEIRNAQNGRLRQVISGRDIRCLDDGLNGTSAQGSGQDGKSARRIKLAMQHPYLDRTQLVVELCLNEGLKE